MWINLVVVGIVTKGLHRTSRQAVTSRTQAWHAPHLYISIASNVDEYQRYMYCIAYIRIMIQQCIKY